MEGHRGCKRAAAAAVPDTGAGDRPAQERAGSAEGPAAAGIELAPLAAIACCQQAVWLPLSVHVCGGQFVLPRARATVVRLVACNMSEAGCGVFVVFDHAHQTSLACKHSCDSS